jgi:hypothetical protein
VSVETRFGSAGLILWRTPTDAPGPLHETRPLAAGDWAPLIDRLTLHAHRLTAQNLDGGALRLEAEPPKDFRATLNQLRRHNR